MAIGLLDVREQPCRLDHDLHPEGFPGQLRRRLGADDFDFLPIHDQHVVLSLVRRGFLRADFAFEAALDRVVFEQIRQIVRRDDIAHGDHFHVFANQSLFGDGAKHQAADPSEPVNCNFNCHI